MPATFPLVAHSRRGGGPSVMDAAHHLIRQRDTPTGDPRFVVAYLAAELDRNPMLAASQLEGAFTEIRAAFAPIAAATKKLLRWVDDVSMTPEEYFEHHDHDQETP